MFRHSKLQLNKDGCWDSGKEAGKLASDLFIIMKAGYLEVEIMLVFSDIKFVKSGFTILKGAFCLTRDKLKVSLIGCPPVRLTDWFTG